MIFFSIETLIEKIKPVLTEKHFFEERRDSKLKIISAFPDIKIVMHESKKPSIECPTTIIELSINTSMGEAKPVATQDIKFEN